MAVNTWDGSSSTDWGTAANWTTTGVTDRVPTADDDVVIPDCSSINNCILDGDTTINSLELAASSNFSMNNHDLTIDGENGSGRAIDVGSNTLTFVGGTGTLIFTLGSGTTKLQGIQHLAASTELRNVQFNGGATFQLEGDTTITGNLTISAGTLTTLDSDGSTSRNLTVTGDVDITGTLTGNASAISLGSLTINSGGTYNATSGTTTITTGGTIAGTGDMAFGGEGTFIHNNGTLVLDSTLHRIPTGGTFYNLTLNGEQNADGIYGYTTTMLPQGIMPDGTTGAAYMSILGTLQINNDEFRPYNIDKIFIHNLVIGDGTGSANSAKFDMSEVDTFDGTVFVDNVTINSDGQLLFGDGDETSSTAGSSALNIYGAFRNIGGSVDIA